MCKTELENIVCPKGVLKPYASFQVVGSEHLPGYTYNHKARMFFPKEHYKTHIETLWQCRCRQCNALKRDVKALKAHYAGEHNIIMCGLCMEHKHSFPSEERCYTQAEYEVHLRDGGGDGSEGHPNCDFCRKRYYDRTSLFTHLTKDHYSCFLCDRDGVKFKYYADYTALDRHFKRDHFACRDRYCMEQKFVVFSSEIELHSHNMAFHPNLNVASRSVPVHFQSSNRTQRDRRDGRGGGRSLEEVEEHNEVDADLPDFEGEWQVVVNMTTGNDERGGSGSSSSSGSGVGGASTERAANGESRRLSNDFPALAVSDTPSFGVAGHGPGNHNYSSLGRGGGSGGTGGRSIASSLSDFTVSAGLSRGTGGADAGGGGGSFGLGANVRIKVDKRLARKNKSSGSLREGGGADSGSGSGGGGRGGTATSVPGPVPLVRASSTGAVTGGGSGGWQEGGANPSPVTGLDESAFPETLSAFAGVHAHNEFGAGARKQAVSDKKGGTKKSASRSDLGMLLASAGVNQPKVVKKSSISMSRSVKKVGGASGNITVGRPVTSTGGVFSFGGGGGNGGASSAPKPSWISIGGAGRLPAGAGADGAGTGTGTGLGAPTTSSGGGGWGGASAASIAAAAAPQRAPMVVPDNDLPAAIPKTSKQAHKKKKKQSLMDLAYNL
jgi:hypothetical protein